MSNWLLLRGLVREKRQWGPFLDIFQKSMKDSKIHCLDLPGIGSEIQRNSPTMVGGITDDLRTRWLEIEKVPGPCYLMSISLGSMIAMDWCARYPQDFKGVVLVNSSAKNLSLAWERLNWKILPALLKAATQQDGFQRERGIIKLTSNMQKDIDSLAKEWAGYVTNRSRIRKTALCQIRAAMSFKCPEKLPIAGLVLSSLRDRFTSSRCSEAIAAHFGIPLCVHPEAGHDLPLDDPKWVTEQIKLFVKLLK